MRIISDQTSLSLFHHKASVAPRSSNAIFTNVKHVLLDPATQSSPPATQSSTTSNLCSSIRRRNFRLIFLRTKRNFGAKCGVVYLDVQCDHVLVAYRSGGGWGSQQAAWSNVIFFFISFLRFLYFIDFCVWFAKNVGLIWRVWKHGGWRLGLFFLAVGFGFLLF